MSDSAAIQDLCEAVIDCPHSTPKWTDTGILVLRSQNIRDGRLDLSKKSYTDETHYQDRSRRAELRGGDLVITREAPMGEVCMIPDNLRCCLGQRMVLLRPNLSRCNARYLLYALQSPAVQNQISWSEGTGSTVSNLRIPHLKALRIRTPPKPEQEAIAGVLGALDDKIEQNRRTARALERLARAIFRAWFVEFEPVKAKAEGATSFPSMPQDVFDALPTRFVDAEIGPVPDGWEVKALGEVVNLTMGQSPKSEFYNQQGEGLPFHQGVSDHGFRFPTRRVYCTIEGRLADAGDILLSVRAPVGRINVADVKMVLGRGLAGLRHRSGRQSFLLYQMQHLFAEDDTMGEGTIYKAVNKKYLKEIPLLVESGMVEDAFERVAKPIDQMITSTIKESHKLAEMRDYLLPKLMNGSVRVRDAANVPENPPL